ENLLLERWRNRPGENLVLIRGLPAAPDLPGVPDAVQVFNHLPARELLQQIANAQSIVCRSGYSSLMDLLPLNKRLVLVPTPGQTEQEYLAKLHHQPAAGRFSLNQKDILGHHTEQGWI
ncbi:MAG: glycosyltransferase, partial [Flavihumibacter sp.]